MFYFFLLTAFTVSLDSFVCGFSLSLMKGKKWAIVLGITLTVFIMCLITNYLALFFSDYLTEKHTAIGGAILILIGGYNLITQSETTTPTDKNGIYQTLIAGFAVGLDGAVANLSLSIMGVNAFYVPLTIAIFHGIMIYLGATLKNLPLFNKINKVSIIAPIVLILLGVYKITTVFI